MVEKAKKTVLITGANGLLGRALVKRLGQKYKVAALTRKDCDVTDSKKVAAVFASIRPWAVIHTAGYTDVDGCQKDARKAFAVNAQGTYNIARQASRFCSALIYISTDYVFSGRKKTPYREEDRALPLSIYGRSKLKGEKFVRQLTKKHFIIRTSWLFGQGRVGFVDKVVAWAKSKKTLKIVSDKYASPTYAADLTYAIAGILKAVDSAAWDERLYGTYHITNSGFCSWYGWARYILGKVRAKARIEPIRMLQMNFAARRPPFSVLDKSKYRKVFRLRLRPWQEAVKEYIACTYN